MHPLSGHTIVLMPGMDGTGGLFGPLKKLLPKDVNVKIVRYPKDQLLSFEETVQCAKEQIEADDNLILLAESFSGPIAVSLIGSGQIKAKYLILCTTFARPPRPVFFKALTYLPLELLIRIPFPRFILNRRIGLGKEETDLFLAMWKEVKFRVPAKTLVHRLKLINKVNVIGWLPKITIPCLYLQASADRSVPLSALNDFIELVPDLRIRRVPGPHFLLQSQPKACLSAIKTFVKMSSGNRGKVVFAFFEEDEDENDI